jgi:chitinase
LGAVQVMGLNENRPPVISSLTASPLLLTMTDTARTVIARASAYDLDPETTLSYTWSLNGIAQEACTATTCSVNIPASAGSHVIELIVGDGVSSTSRTVTVQVSNRAPVISAMSVSPASVEIGAIDRSVTASVTASDPDNTSLTYTWTLNGVEQACSGSSCTATLPATEGLYTFRVVVSDGDRKVERSVVATVSSTNLSIGVR